jgi:hypothetical protein
MFCAAVMCGQSAYDWNTSAAPRRSGGRCAMSRPSTRMRPSCTGRKPQMARSSVVLPQPELPSSATSSPRCTPSDMPRRTGVDP